MGDHWTGAALSRARVSARDPEELTAALASWLAAKLPGARPTLGAVHAPSLNGMSNQTLILEAEWDVAGIRTQHPLVVRLPPADDDVPLFPFYDLSRQVRVMRDVARLGLAPLPEVLWLERSPEFLGAPFFVMRKVEGRVPGDVVPYTTAGFVVDATAAERAELERQTVAAVAGIHRAPDPAGTVPYLISPRPCSDDWLDRHLHEQRAYYEWAASDGVRPSLLEQAFAWLESHRPPRRPAVLLWGDARCGNIIFDGFRVAAILDWELAAIGPAGIDLGWMVFTHMNFQDKAAALGLPGLPELFIVDSVTQRYAELAGRDDIDLEFHVLFAAVRHAIMSLRMANRGIWFGESAPPADPNDRIRSRLTLEKLLG
jgi:aminoglycoside phosphotransferase (APT) family kinase protein